MSEKMLIVSFLRIEVVSSFKFWPVIFMYVYILFFFFLRVCVKVKAVVSFLNLGS